MINYVVISISRFVMMYYCECLGAYASRRRQAATNSKTHTKDSNLELELAEREKRIEIESVYKGLQAVISEV